MNLLRSNVGRRTWNSGQSGRRRNKSGVNKCMSSMKSRNISILRTYMTILNDMTLICNNCIISCCNVLQCAQFPCNYNTVAEILIVLCLKQQKHQHLEQGQVVNLDVILHARVHPSKILKMEQVCDRLT